MVLTILLAVLEGIAWGVGIIAGLAFFCLLVWAIASATVADPRVESYERMSREDILSGGRKHGDGDEGDGTRTDS